MTRRWALLLECRCSAQAPSRSCTPSVSSSQPSGNLRQLERRRRLLGHTAQSGRGEIVSQLTRRAAPETGRQFQPKTVKVAAAQAGHGHGGGGWLGGRGWDASMRACETKWQRLRNPALGQSRCLECECEGESDDTHLALRCSNPGCLRRRRVSCTPIV